MSVNMALFVCLLALLFPLSVPALNLMDAYQAALGNDPTFAAAYHDREASRQSVPMARAGLLPQLTINGSYSMSVGENETPAQKQSVTQTITQGGRSVTQTISTDSPARASTVEYTSDQYGISMRWSILNLEAIARFRQAHALEAYGQARFGAAYNDLVLRLAAAYFDVLLADDTVEQAGAQVEAYARQKLAAERRWQEGEGTITDIAETEARLATAEAELVAAEDQRNLTRTALRLMTGLDVAELQALRKDFAAEAIEPAQPETWQAWAQELSPVLLAQRLALESARHDVDRNHAGHWPKLDVVGSVSDSHSDSQAFANYRFQSNSIGVQLTFPIFTGGYVSAATAQAEASLRRIQSELEARTNAVMQDTQRYLRAVLSGVKQVAAYEKAVQAQEVAVKGAEVGFKFGTRTQVEMLDANRLLFQAKRNLSQARYQYLLGRLRLMGTIRPLTEEDLRLVNATLAP